jgi:hypothetical protein
MSSLILRGLILGSTGENDQDILENGRGCVRTRRKDYRGCDLCIVSVWGCEAMLTSVCERYD